MKRVADNQRSLLQFSAKASGKVLWLAAAAGLAVGVFLTCRKSPAFQSIRWLPLPVAKWADRHGVLRNLPAYSLLAAPFLLLTRKHLGWRAGTMLLLAALAALMEFIQLWIPTRVADWKDVAASWAGLLIAWGIFETARWSGRVWLAGKTETQTQSL